MYARKLIASPKNTPRLMTKILTKTLPSCIKQKKQKKGFRSNNIIHYRDMICETPHRLKRGTSISEDAGHRRKVNCEIPHRFERGTSVNENVEHRRKVDCEILYRITLYRGCGNLFLIDAF